MDAAVTTRSVVGLGEGTRRRGVKKYPKMVQEVYFRVKSAYPLYSL